MPISIAVATGVITPITGVNYKTMTQAQFTESTGANNQFQYTSKGAARLAASFNNGAVQHFEVPLRHICGTAKCESIFPAGKKYYITLQKTKEPFLMQSIDPTAADHLMFQLTECEIEVPIVELQPEKQEQERQKIAAPEGIVYPIRNDYTQTFYIHPHNTSIYNNNITNGYKAKYIYCFTGWISHMKLI